jgi:hypothetical protein
MSNFNKVEGEKPPKKKILLLSDDCRLHSGIATQSMQLIKSTIGDFDWVQLGSARKHPEHGQIFDLSKHLSEETGVEDSYLKVYAHSGYGNPQVLSELIQAERPDAIMIFTDPRFWEWLFAIENEVRAQMPIFYWNIWDATPAPNWNYPFYKSVDAIFNISKQTHALVESVFINNGDASSIEKL